MTVHVAREGAVITATIDRPEALNAIDLPTMAALEEVLDLVEADEECRVLVLTGTGTECFISGGDLRKFEALTNEQDVRAMAVRMSAILSRFETLDAWVVASMNGSAYGGGCETAIACDFRLASAHARFGFTQAKFCVPPGWGGLTRLIELVGKPTALWWLARQAVVDADEALAAGLVHEVVAADRLAAATTELALRVADMPRDLVRALKQGAHRARELPRSEALREELAPFVRCWLSDAHHESVQAFLMRSD